MKKETELSEIQKEILTLNKIRQTRESDFIFTDDKLFPSQIVIHSKTYGKYNLTPSAFLDFTNSDWKRVMLANTEVRKMSGAMMTYSIEESIISGIKQSVKFVIYLCDLDENKDWFENNKDCDIIKKYPEDIKTYKNYGLPIGTKNLKEKLEDFYKKYPMVNPNLY